MISWKELIHCLTELEKLENGYGSEIEFQYAGKYYYIDSYRDYKGFSCQPDVRIPNNFTELRYTNYEELGQATDFGFRLSEVWNDVEELICKPDFEDFGLERILDAYRTALENRRMHKEKKQKK